MNDKSTQKLLLAHPDLQRVFFEVDKYFPCQIICSVRGEQDQNKAFSEGKSKLKFPQSKHNKMPSLAVDVIPVHDSFSWDNYRLFFFFAGIVDSISRQLNVKIRWGGDWNKDYNFLNEKFIDLPHYELEL